MPTTNPKHEITVDREKLQVRMSRVFAASRERLWKAHTDAAEIPMWFGPAKYKTTVDKMDVREGGHWRFLHHDPDGTEYAFHGEYLELVEPDHITWTFVFEGIPDADNHVITETVTFTELPGGKTRVDTVSRYDNIEDLEGMVSSGMEEGATESWDRLAALVE